jgi:mRNA interferase MazF
LRATVLMRRGEIWLANLQPTLGNEADTSRPVVIVSNNGANGIAERLGTGVVTVVPVTGNVKTVYAFQTYLPRSATGLRQNSKAQAEQVRAIDVRRLGRRLGAVPAAQLRELDEALRLHLSL